MADTLHRDNWDQYAAIREQEIARKHAARLDTLPNAAAIQGFPKDDVDAAVMPLEGNEK